MSRQIEEGVEILNSKADIIMNAKGEWNGSKLPRILIERGDSIETDEDDPTNRMWREDDRNFWAVKKVTSTKRKDDHREEEVSEIEIVTNPKKRVKLYNTKKVTLHQPLITSLFRQIGDQLPQTLEQVPPGQEAEEGECEAGAQEVPEHLHHHQEDPLQPTKGKVTGRVGPTRLDAGKVQSQDELEAENGSQDENVNLTQKEEVFRGVKNWEVRENRYFVSVIGEKQQEQAQVRENEPQAEPETTAAEEDPAQDYSVFEVDVATERRRAQRQLWDEWWRGARHSNTSVNSPSQPSPKYNQKQNKKEINVVKIKNSKSLEKKKIGKKKGANCLQLSVKQLIARLEKNSDSGQGPVGR